MYISEIFSSIQGEGKYTGYPTTFIRLHGCNLEKPCKYCDTLYAINGKRKKMHLGLIVDAVNRLGNKYVCITGGEPLMQEECMPLVYELLSLYYEVTIETNGSILLEESTYSRSYSYCMDIKLSSSRSPLAKDSNCYRNLSLLKGQDEVKFVITSLADYKEATKILKKYPTKAKVLFYPVNGDIEIGKMISEKLIADKVNARVGIQLQRVFDLK